MARTESTMNLEPGTDAPAFSLPDTDGHTVSLSDFAGKPLLVAFICNHCPFVKHIAEGFADLVKAYQAKGVGAVAVMSNNVEDYPDDSPEKMAETKRAWGLTLPYLYDADQSVAQAYHAACTPDFFVFDKDHKLVYRGQMDDSRPNSGVPVTGEDLRAALEAVLAGKPVPQPQKPSVGCNIKWKKGNEPAYFA